MVPSRRPGVAPGEPLPTIIVTGSAQARLETFGQARDLCLEHTRRSRTELGCISHNAFMRDVRKLAANGAPAKIYEADEVPPPT